MAELEWNSKQNMGHLKRKIKQHSRASRVALAAAAAAAVGLAATHAEELGDEVQVLTQEWRKKLGRWWDDEEGVQQEAILYFAGLVIPLTLVQWHS